MGKLSLDKKEIIVIYDKSDVLRTSLGVILSNHGFKNVRHVKSAEEALAILGQESVSWLFSYLCSDDNITGFHILRFCLDQKSQSSTKISLFFDESEDSLIPLAMSYGLFSAHQATFTAVSLDNEFRELMRTIRDLKDDTLVAGHCLYHYLLTNKQYPALIDLCKKIISFYPNRSEPLLWLAEAYFQASRPGDGAHILFKISNTPGLENDIARLSQMYLNRDLEARDQIPTIDGCVVIDSDLASLNQMKGILGVIGAKNVHCFTTSDDAFKFLANNLSTQLVITEWKQPSVKGPTVIQRVREMGLYYTTLIIASAQVKKEDVCLIREFEVASIISKPYDDVASIKSIVNAVRQDQFPEEIAAIQRKLRSALRAHEVTDSRQLIEILSKNKDFPESELLELKAEIEFLAGHYQEAEDLASSALNKGNRSLFLYDLLGKVAFHREKYEEAINYLEKSFQVSPMSVERLCFISQIYSRLKRPLKAQKSLKDAMKIDPNSVLVKEAGLEIIKGDMKHNDIEDLLGDSDSTDGLVSFWNKRAVDLVKKQNYAEAIKTYKKALLALPKGMSDNRSFLRYNLALAYARHNKYNKARLYLETTICEEDSPVLGKSLSLYRKIIDYLENGTEVHITQAEQGSDEVNIISHQDLNELKYCSLSGGDYCLYKVYFFKGSLPRSTKHLLSSLPTSQAVEVA